ncbi:2171_t:CDS:2 [Dentiscutata heterogama]|uniref:2171_t:CDS:1 n=1 Tax=Dentiscutata heterogama TaxID=1316150 RepID=A0ACA9M7T8_9GLOM|nr:2171_t:CDS:2 [Dentiscutata heterogama]
MYPPANAPTQNVEEVAGSLPASKADEVINQLLGEQLEIYELEKQLKNLQLQENQTGYQKVK